MRRTCLIAAALCLLQPTPTPAAAVTLEAVLATMRRTPPASEPFHDVRFRRALKAPLVSSGTLVWRGGLDFERRVDSPYREVGQVHGRTLTVRRERGGERVIPLARAPELQVLFAGLSALFAADASAIGREFEVELEGERNWRLRLVPRDEHLRERVEALALHGDAAGARCLVVTQPAAQTLTLFGAAESPAPAGDFAATVAAYCPMP